MTIDERMLMSDPVQARNSAFQTGPTKRVWIKPKWSPANEAQSVGVGANGDGGGSPARPQQTANTHWEPPTQTPAPAPLSGGFKAERASPAPSPRQEGQGGRWQGAYGYEGLAPQQFNSGVDFDTATAICGEVAAVAFARATGRNPTVAEAVAMAQGDQSKGQDALWDTQTGMYGPHSELTLLQRMGVSARLEDAPSKARVIADLQNGNPVILSSPGKYHYFVVTQYDKDTDTFNAGNTGNVWKSGSPLNHTWRTWDDIGPQAALYLDEPSSPTSSVAVGNEGQGSGAQPITPPPDAKLPPEAVAPSQDFLNIGVQWSGNQAIPGAPPADASIPYRSASGTQTTGGVIPHAPPPAGPASSTTVNPAMAGSSAMQSVPTWPDQPPSSARRVQPTQPDTSAGVSGSGVPPQGPAIGRQMQQNTQPGNTTPQGTPPRQSGSYQNGSIDPENADKAFGYYLWQNWQKYGASPQDPNVRAQARDQFLKDQTSGNGWLGSALGMAGNHELDWTPGWMKTNTNAWTDTSQLRNTKPGTTASEPSDQSTWAAGVTDQPGWAPGTLRNDRG